MTPRTANRLKLAGIAAAGLLPVVAAYLLYWFWVPERYTNYGELLEPRAVPKQELATADGRAFTFGQLHGRWVLVVIGGGDCADACEKRLWLIRQIRRTQGKDQDRIERAWLIDDGRMPAERLARDYAGTWFVQARGSALLASFPAQDSPRDHIYLVDPLGNVIIRFPRAPDPKAIMRDLSRLLRYSSIG